MIRNKEKYAPGGEYFEELSNQFGLNAAQLVYQASLTDNPMELNKALSKARTAQRQRIDVENVDSTYPVGSDSTAENFWSQMTTDPFDAPAEAAGNAARKALDAANKALKESAKGIVFNPFVLIALVFVGFYMLGGFGYVKRRVSNG